MRLKQRAQIAVAVAVAATPILPVASTATASAAKVTDANDVPSDATPYCSTVELSAEQLKAGVTSDVKCFATMAESLAAIGVTDVAVSDGLNEDLRDGGGAQTNSIVTGLVGIHYQSYGSIGTSLAIGGDDCNGGGINFANGDPWNDTIRSTRHEGCSKIKYWVDVNQGGAYQVTTGGVAAPRDMNATLADNVSSIAYYGPAN